MNILHYTGMATAQKFGGVEKWFVEFSRQARIAGHMTFISYLEKYPENCLLRKAYQESGLHPLITLNGNRNLLLKQIEENDIKIVFFHFVEPYNGPLFIKKHTKCKVYCFFHCHNYYSGLNWLSDFREMSLASFYRWSVFKSQFYIDGFFPVSKAVKKQFEHFCFLNPYKCHQIYLGIDKKEYTQPGSLSHSVPVIGCVACHGSYKGLDILLESAEILKSRNCKFEIWQIGGGMSFNNGKDTEELHRMCKEKGLEDCFKWLGVRNDAEFLMKQMDIYVQPSRREAISLTIAEAMMSGLPVVASNVDGIPEYMSHGENGFLYDHNDPVLLANALQLLIENKDLRDKMGKKSYELINDIKFDRTNNIKTLIKRTIK